MNLKAIKISNRMLGEGHPPLVVAELSGNHNQSLENAFKLLDAAAKAGVEAVKIQTYTADTLTIDADTEDFMIKGEGSIFNGYRLYDLYEKAHTPWEWHQPLFERSRELGLICFSTPFDDTAVDYLENLGAPCYKIASFENNYLPLLRKVAQTGKPIIMSTGMATLETLEIAVKTLRENGCKDLILLKCASAYPAEPTDSNLTTLPHMRDLFQCQVGLSDHTMGLGVALAAVPLGAVLIEKHFTLSRSDGGVDAAFSMEPEEIADLVKESKRAWQALGKVSYGPTDNEKPSLVGRRSIYIARDVEAGEVLTPDNLKIIRPGYGLDPKYYDLLLGKKMQVAAKKGTAMQWNLVIDSA